jgi:hypothetical protein
MFDHYSTFDREMVTYEKPTTSLCFPSFIFIIASWCLGPFTFGVPLFGHMTQELCFYYLPNIKFTWNNFKCKILDNSNYVNFHGGGDFLHAYVIMHQYFGLKIKNVKIEYISFYEQLDIFSCMIFSCTFCWHLGPQILSLVNKKINQMA